MELNRKNAGISDRTYSFNHSVIGLTINLQSGRNIFDSISRIVDEIFANYVSRPNVKQPILTQYCDGKRVLFECSDAFRDYIRNNREVSKRLKETIYRVSRTKYSIGPYEEPKADATTAAVSLDETLHTMQALGVDLKIVDK